MDVNNIMIEACY